MAPAAKNTFRKLQVVTKTTNFAEAVKVMEVPLVAPAPDQIRVKQIYAGVNAADINVTAGKFLSGAAVPFDIGFEAIGLVDAIGSSVPAGKFKVGQPVLVLDLASQQAFAEYSYKTVDALIPIPSQDPKFLVVPGSGLTAAIALDKAGRIQTGDRVLITAAAGGTGQIAVQWAKQKGAYVIGLTSSEEKAKFLTEQLGADEVINYRTQNLDQVLTEKFPNGVDVIWETIGGETFKTLFEHLGANGRLVIIGSIQGYKDGGIEDLQIPNINQRLQFGSRSLNGFALLDHVADFVAYFPKLIGGIATGAIKAQVDLGDRSPGGKFVGVDQIYRAQEWLHSSKSIGKVVVQLQ